MFADILSGRKLGSYTVGALIGQGSAASVYRAYDAKDKVVALKVLSSFAASNAQIRARFQREAQAGTTLSHPGIVPVLDVGQSDNYHYLVMPLVEGESLMRRQVRKPALDQGTAVDVVRQIAEALDYAHRHGIVHRDIKPANVLLTPDGRAMVTDFGIARTLNAAALTRTGQMIGTFYYSAPEQSQFNAAIDGRTDLYSLGVLLYQLITNRLPFTGSMAEVLTGHQSELAPAPSSLVPVDPELESIIQKALAKNPADRFQTGAEMAAALAALPLKPAPQPVSAGWWSSLTRFFGS
ncbi:MAG TPA: serine/threonine-protein kinase [Anaerolineae bacterium]|nr:serine/threonine-protein kinase [Anaerolineae bacterium]HMR68406.1 serine/threonine-protein kinase [Anaerolineae bacterium]